MHYLKDPKSTNAKKYLFEAAKIAEKETCRRARCGTVIVKNNDVTGSGFNSPAGDIENQRRCLIEKDSIHQKVTDKTCCVHAEQRAIFDALRKNADKLAGSTLYFIRLDKDGKKEKAGKPYCTICSKSALDVGIAAFVLWHEEGVCAYDTKEYNLRSYKYKD